VEIVMKITLASLGTLRSAVEAYQPPAVVLTVQLFNHTIAGLEAVRESTESAARGYAESLLKKWQVVQQLRQLVFEANTASGVAAHLSVLASTDRQLADLGRLQQRCSSENLRGFTTSRFAEAVEVRNGLPAERQTDPQRVPVFLAEGLDTWLATTIAQLQRDRRQIEANRGRANAETLVELPKELVDYLRVIGIL
jgi:hypothetical protein